MRGVGKLAAWLIAGLLACAARSEAAPEVVTLRPVAHSAQLTLEAAAAPGGVMLRVRDTATQAPLEVTDLGVSVDGRSASAMRRADGAWFVPLTATGAAADRKLDVVIAHDGIREVLSGSVPPPPAPGGGTRGLFGDHKQLAWWILNITVVLIAAIAISRRMS
ncbi:MAG TPA: hypothetical protein VEU54_04285 [Steroidobacteraceae bacterium]|nr:hypothetical protein [Steroidobacteraceae bacterium]